jgi:hypothetical protein
MDSAGVSSTSKRQCGCFIGGVSNKELTQCSTVLLESHLEDKASPLLTCSTVYFTTLSSVQSVQHQMINDFKKMWKEAAMA